MTRRGTRWLLAAALLAAAAAPAAAQQPTLPPAKRAILERRRAAAGLPPAAAVPQDTTGRAAADTGAAQGNALPTGPSRSFVPLDSVEQALLARPNYRVTRYAADSVQFLPIQKQIRMAGQALVQREGSILQADTVHYTESSCALRANGSPVLFDSTGTMVGHAMLYDACNHAGLIGRARTDFKEGSATWYLHGDIAVDNANNHVFAARSNITTSDQPDPDYHFAASQVKWISKQVMVARPALLYVADVPIMWLPFIFQDLHHGRRSGLIPPQFGLNDIVRTSRTYHRHIANLGYYWVINDYTDAEVTMDWYSQQYLTVNGQFRYRWLSQFMSGGIGFSELHWFNGSTSYHVQWQHQQSFSQTSRLTANIDYATSSQIISQSTVDPVLAVSTIDSRVNFQKQFAWGSLSLGGSRTQQLATPQVSMQLPVVAFTPNPIALSRNVTWSPSFSVTNQLQTGLPGGGFSYGPVPGDSSARLETTRNTSVSLSTPLRIGRWTWANSFSLTDAYNNLTQTVTSHPNPADTSITVVRTYSEYFETDLDWSTGISLPLVFQGGWNLQPSVSIVNTTGGPFMLRNRYTGGRFVTQGKRLNYALSISPTFYGLFPGFGPIARIRHTFSPSLSWAYSPAANIPLEYARALAGDNPVVTTRSPASQTLTLGLNQTFEAKLKAPPLAPGADTAGAPKPEGRKIKLLSIQTGAVAVDLEQAKTPGHTGWVTGSLSNTFATDLLPGFTLSTTHSLFNGPVGVAGTKFHPYLTNLSMRFGLGPSVFGWIGSLLGLTRQPAAATPSAAAQAAQDSARAARDTTGVPQLFPDAYQRGPVSTMPGVGPLASGVGVGAFTASLAFDLSRQPPYSTTLPSASGITAPTIIVPTAHSTLSGSISFSPTRNWSVSWQTLYDFQRGRFGQHVLMLNRDMRDWKATFSFVEAANGNVVFNFDIRLIPEPEIKMDYDQRNTPALP